MANGFRNGAAFWRSEKKKNNVARTAPSVMAPAAPAAAARPFAFRIKTLNIMLQW